MAYYFNLGMFCMNKMVTQLLIFTLGTLSIIFSQDDGVLLTIDNVDEDIQTFDILYSSPEDVYGFQFNISGIAITDIDEDIAGIFSFDNNSVLGLSFTGETLLPDTNDGSAVLMTIYYELDGSGSDICLSNLVFGGYEGVELSASAGECYQIISGITVSFGDEVMVNVDDLTNTTTRSLDINYESTVDINGFQLTVEGVDLIGAQSIFFDENELLLSQSTGTIIGFSLSGAMIPAGAGTFLSIEFGGEAEADLCIVDPAFTTQIDGQNVYAQIQFEDSNCVDIPATSYDCNDTPNGTAELDSCGVCSGGSGPDVHSHRRSLQRFPLEPGCRRAATPGPARRLQSWMEAPRPWP